MKANVGTNTIAFFLCSMFFFVKKGKRFWLNLPKLNFEDILICKKINKYMSIFFLFS